MLTNSKKVVKISNNKVVGFGDHVPDFMLKAYFSGRRANARKISTRKHKQQVA